MYKSYYNIMIIEYKFNILRFFFQNTKKKYVLNYLKIVKDLILGK